MTDAKPTVLIIDDADPDLCASIARWSVAIKLDMNAKLFLSPFPDFLSFDPPDGPTLPGPRHESARAERS